MAAKGAFALLNKNSYRLHELNEESWKSLQAEAADEEISKTVAFVDGGNAELIKNPTAAIHRIRTAVVVVHGKKIKLVRQKDGFITVKAVVDGSSGRIRYKAHIFDSNLDRIGCESNSAITFEQFELLTSSNGTDSGTALTKAAEVIRKLAEIAAAKWAAGNCADAKFVVLDGTLEAFGSKEKKEMESLQTEAAASGIIAGSVAKTCSLLTDSGDSLISLAEAASGGKTGYMAVADGLTEKHMAKIAVAKLNSSATHLFRIECGGGSDLGAFATALAAQSNDLAFPGYPYGLIMADRFARISDSDTELTKAKMKATATAEIKELMKHEKALNAHSILDRM